MRPSRYPLAIALLAAAALALGGCAITSVEGSAPPPVESAGDFVAVIVASDMAFSNGKTGVSDQPIGVPADEAFELLFVNEDAMPHNVAIYTDESASEPIYVGEMITGSRGQVESIPALPAGEYFFRCDVHPAMVGTIVAA